ncbi:MAG: ArnT family glycosyltransferase [Candidatus Nanopelagicales bacterium]
MSTPTDQLLTDPTRTVLLPPPTGEPVIAVPPPTAPRAESPAGAARSATARPEPTPHTRRLLLALLLLGTAVLYIWGLSKNGWANAFYSAAAQAGGESWKAWFFGSFDAANAITVDKPPAALWVMGWSVRVFGLSPWAILAPQALMGVAAVALVYATVRRWFGTYAGLIAGAILALSPVATLMFRFNNPDALLVLLLVAAACAMTRAVETGSLRWILLAGVLVGLGFLTKMMQAFLVLPGFVAMYAVAAPLTWRTRLWHLLAAFGAVIASAGWWVAIVELWPESSRPFIGGSQTNSMLELIFGYNGFGRLTGEEVGSVGGGGGQGGRWGTAGIGRLFTASYGGQIAWLLPTAVAMLAVLLWLSRREARTSRLRAAALGWGGWLLVTAAVISFSQGIIHEYYTVALAPAIGALIGIAAMELWERRGFLAARLAMLGLLAGTAIWGFVLLSRSADFVPWLRYVVLFGGLGLAGLLSLSARLPRRAPAAVGLGALAVSLAGPAAYSVETVGSVASGSLPTAGPTVSGARGGIGRMGTRAGNGGATGRGQFSGPPGGAGGQTAPGQAPGGAGAPGGNTGTGTPSGGMGGLLSASTPSAELVAALTADADRFTWVAATTGAQSAAGVQLATGRPVLAIGGFNGSDPFPTLERFQEMVNAGQVHYYLPGGGAAGGRGLSTSPNSTGSPNITTTPNSNRGVQQNGGSRSSAEIASWVAANFTAVTIGGTTAYDLTAPLSASSGTATSAGTTNSA